MGDDTAHAVLTVGAPQRRAPRLDPTGSVIDNSADRLREEALTFLRRFGLVSTVWCTILAATVPDPGAGRPAVLWSGIAVVWVWAIASQFVPDWWAWGIGWMVVAVGLEMLGPFAATDGWNVTGGASFIVVAAAALAGRRRLVVLAVVVLSSITFARWILAPGWNLGSTVRAILFFAFGGLTMAWLSSVLQTVLNQRDTLQQQLLEIETRTARQQERQESAARLHDTVLQHLTAVTHADGIEDARRQAGRASNELRQFLRQPTSQENGTFRELLEAAAVAAADGADVSISVAGTRPLDDPGRLLVEAMGEAVRNAVAHAQPPIRVFAETSGDASTVWVADNGPGFDPDAVPDDRFGVRESIIGRMTRAGGAATLRSDDSGTEWELTLPT